MVKVLGKGITVTVLFESAALNRGEKIGGNIASIKKLARQDGVYSYFSRESIRHYLFQTLKVGYDWEDAPVTNDGGKSPIQFDFPYANIIEYPEMDLFGYMTTKTPVATRKAPLGITKAISLENWHGGMAFGANHDMVRRANFSGQDATPDPYSKEEHYGYYKLSFTLDVCRVGYSEHVLNEKSAEKMDKQESEESATDQGNKKKSKEKSKNMAMEWFEKLESVSVEEVLEHCTVIAIDKVNQCNWCVIKKDNIIKGFVGLYKEQKQPILIMAVTDAERKKRIKQLLEVLQSGIMLHSNTESYGIVPQFLVCSTLRVPVPIFNDFMHLDKNGVVERKELEFAAENGYVLNAWYDGILANENGYEGIKQGVVAEKVLADLFRQDVE